MIQAQPEGIEQIRARLRKLTDAQLIELGRNCRELCDPNRCYGKPNPAFQLKLEEARTEWRRRHPKVRKSLVCGGRVPTELPIDSTGA
jgi:hypothetical protein